MPDEDRTQGTAQPGSEPGAEGTPEPLEGQQPATPPGTGEGDDEPILGEDGKPVPYNSDPRFRNALKAQRTIKGWMEENEVESIEDLKELIQSGRAVVGKGLDEQALDNVLQRARKMDEVEAYWEQQRELQRRAEEDPEQTLARVEKEKRELERRLHERNVGEESKRNLETFEKNATSFVKEVAKDLSEADREALVFFMGVNHPFGEIDIVSKPQIQKMGKQVLKVVEGIQQRAIKDYIAGKQKLVKVGSASAPAVQPSGEVKNFKQARAATLEKLRSLGNQ
jgi:hypothetical protein